ncbi:hypothetical protein FACS189490_00260 [Clostridia bacterium]|nr:hypothetical protein FACS189490_00260 [Clostridia bacterium]
MRKILLTSAGFETRVISDAFLRLVGKEPIAIKALFIPTAANNADAIEVLPKCMNDLLKVGILKDNINVFDLHRSLSETEMNKFDMVYFTGGSPQYLLKRINETGFSIPLNKFVDNGGVYIGVSAGAVICAANFPNNLCYLKSTLNVHMQDGMADGVFDNQAAVHIDLKNDRAVLIFGEMYRII